jgi:hypothetical protein
MTVSGVRNSIDEKGRARCDFWGRSVDRNGHVRNTPCVAIGQNYDRVRSLIANGAKIHATGVYEVKTEPGKARAFHVIWGSAKSAAAARSTQLAMPLADVV